MTKDEDGGVHGRDAVRATAEGHAAPEGTARGAAEGTPEGTARGAAEGAAEGSIPHHDESEAGRISRARTALIECNRALIRATDEQQLLDAVCRVAVGLGGYSLAWVGFAENDERKTVRPVATYGEAAPYVDDVSVTWGYDKLGRGPTGTAIRTGRVCMTRDLAADPEFPWRAEAARYGLRALLSLPLARDGVAFGAFVVYASEPDAFGRAEIEILVELVDDLAYGIRTLRERSERDRLAAVVEESLDSIIISDYPDMRITYVNAAFAAAAARQPSELVGQDVLDGAAEVLDATTTATLVEYVRSGRPWLGEYDWPQPDGKVLRVEIRVTPRRAADGTLDGFVTVLRDVTELRSGEAERARFSMAMEQVAESISIADLDARIIYVNPAFERVTGYARSEVIGQHLPMINGGIEPPSFYEAIRAALTNGSSWIGDIVNRRKDGSFFTAESVLSPVRDSEGAITSYVAVQRDVTRERALIERSTELFRQRALISETIRGLRGGETPDATAQAICRQVASLTGMAAAQLLIFEPDGYAMPIGFAVSGQADPPMKRLSYQRSRELRGRASDGAWIEPWSYRQDHPSDQPLKGVGVHSLAHAPLSYDGQVIGLLTIQAADRVDKAPIAEALPALIEFTDLAGALIGRDVAQRTSEARSRGHISGIIAQRAFGPVFQPIVDLGRNAIVGYEALTRFVDGSLPDGAFAEAAAVGLGAELEIVTLQAALSAAEALPRSAWLNLNASPGLILAGEPLRSLLRRCRRHIVLEVTEHTAIADYPAFRAAMAALGPKVEFAVDDAGAGFASLRHILELHPAFVKLDRWLVTDLGSDETRKAMIVGLSHFARSVGCRLIAEGIETEAELAALRALDIRLGQGYLLGRPAPLDNV